MLTPLGLPAPTLLHGGVGVYGLFLLAIAIALHPSPRPPSTPIPWLQGSRASSHSWNAHEQECASG